MRSLHARLLLAATLVLAAFFGFGALVLDQAFRNSSEQALRDRLREQIYALLGTADEDQAGRMRLPEAVPNPGFNRPDSGLYAEVVGESGAYRWRSTSMVGQDTRFLQQQAPGATLFREAEWSGERFQVLNFGIAWEDDAGRELVYTLAVAHSTRDVEQQIQAFKTRLLLWVAGVSVLLLLTQGLLLGWGLRPVRKVAADLKRVEEGAIEGISGEYPTELQGLVRNLNALIQSGKASRDRYRNSLGDLAHSFKTPLALLRGASEEGDCGQLRRLVDQQVTRLDDMVQYQLRRAAASGRSTPGVKVRVLPTVRRLASTLETVYREASVRFEILVDEGTYFYGDESDLLELTGNLMENACKYGRGMVRVVTKSDAQAATGLQLLVEDDGPGIPIDARREVLRRGVRADQREAGQGIGLSVANQIVGLYGGMLEIESSDLGGARIRVSFPPH